MKESRNKYKKITCATCRSIRRSKILVCCKCKKSYHKICARPVLTKLPTGPWSCGTCKAYSLSKILRSNKIFEFFGIQGEDNTLGKRDLASFHGKTVNRKRKKGQSRKNGRRWLPWVHTKDAQQRIRQLSSLALALKISRAKFSDELNYSLGAPKSANQASYEDGPVQVISQENLKIVERCKEMFKRGECPPLIVTFDSYLGFNVVADGFIKDMTFITECSGDVDYEKNKKDDDSDNVMTLINGKDTSKSLVVCVDKCGNVFRFMSGVNNHTREGLRKVNCKAIRCNVNGEIRIFLIAIRNIKKGDRLYFNYNGDQDAYPTHNFI